MGARGLTPPQRPVRSYPCAALPQVPPDGNQLMRTMRMRGAGETMGAGLAALWTALGLVGCGQLNNDLVIGDRSRAPEIAALEAGEDARSAGADAYLISTLDPSDGVFDATAPGAPAWDASVPPPSILGVARANWTPIRFNVPVDGTEHWAMHRSDPDRTHETGAQRNEEFPTEFTVIHGPPTLSSNLNQAAEAALAPLYAGLDAVLVVPRLIVDPPWEVMTSPRDAYQRSPQRLPRLRTAPPPEAAEIPIADPLPADERTDPAAAQRAFPEEAPREEAQPPVDLPQSPDEPAEPSPEPQR